MPNLVCMHCYITGKVQGVWFRSSAKKEADKLGLTGWVRNLEDGRVEILACGEKEKVARLYAWLKKGPDLAKVKEVTYEEVPWYEHAKFEVV